MHLLKRLAAGGAACLVSVVACAQGRPPPGRPPAQRGPWENDVHVFRVSPDGDVQRLATFERAGVPTLARLPDGSLLAAFQHFPGNDSERFDRVAVSESIDDGRTWSKPETLHVEGIEPGLMRPFDPTLTPLPDGRIRMYFTSNRHRDIRVGAPAIYSAISDDGVAWRFEPGVRFAVEGRMIIDCAAVLHAGQFHLFAPDNGPAGGLGPEPRPGDERDRPKQGVGYHAVSQDGLTFLRLPDVEIEGRRRWLGNALSDGRQITFAGTEEGDPARGGRGGVWMAVSSDAVHWKLLPTLELRGADPGLALIGGDHWIVAVTSPPVAGREQEGPRLRPIGPLR